MNQLEESSRPSGIPDSGHDRLWGVAAEEEISLLDVLVTLAQKRRRVAISVVCAILIGVIVSLVLPIRYTATTSILPPQQNSSVGAALMSQLGSLGALGSLAGGGLGLKNPNDMQVALLKSRTVEDAMLDRFNLVNLYHSKRRSAARKKFESYVDIDDGAKDGIIRIDITDGSAQRAADMANAYVDEFRKFSSTLAVTEASQRRLFFEQQMVQAKDNLAKSEEALKETEQKTGLIQLDAQARTTIELIANLRAQIAAKEVEINALRSYETADNPQLQLAEQQLAGLQAQEQKIGGSSEGAANALVSKGNLQKSSIEYIQRLRDVKYYETIFDLLARQYEIAKVDEARQGATVQIVDRAVVPDIKSAPKRTLIVIGFAFLGLIFGVISVLASESLARISRNPAERLRLETLKGLVLPGKR